MVEEATTRRAVECFVVIQVSWKVGLLWSVSSGIKPPYQREACQEVVFEAETGKGDSRVFDSCLDSVFPTHTHADW